MINIFLISVIFAIPLMHLIAVEPLELEVIPYEKLIQGDIQALQTLDKALREKGIIGVGGAPGYCEKYEQFIKAAREFSALPEEIKEGYRPNKTLGEIFLGYEVGREKFPHADWSSYYAYIPDSSQNKWPSEVNLRDSFVALGQLVANTGEIIMHKVGLLGSPLGFELEENSRLGRMLHYRNSDNNDNPYWCDAHFDYGLFTAILPAVYFINGKQIAEPSEAGLFIRISKEEPFRKVSAKDLDVMMFQVGEFGQLMTNDGIRATEHRVHKAQGLIERYTLAVFFSPPMDIPIYSTSELTQDVRYGGKSGDPCTYRHWHEASTH